MNTEPAVKKKRIILTVIALCILTAALSAYLLTPLLSAGGAGVMQDMRATSDEEDALHLGMEKFLGGFVTLGGRQYYFDASGVMQKNGIVGSPEEGYTIADENGVCCVSEEIRLAASFMMKYCTGDTLDERMKTGFLYLAHHFPYARSYDHPSRARQLSAMAVEMFTNQKGNCYRYAACFACLAKIAGYRVRVVLGKTAVWNPHGWTEVLVDGKWLICDPDAQLPGNKLPDYFAYMMEEHCWVVTPERYFELTINEDGVAVWRRVLP